MVSDYGHGWTKAKEDTKEKVIKFIKEKYHPDKTTIEIKDILEFFSITDEELIKDYASEVNRE